MTGSIVSVRMPSSLVQKLRELAKENHFLDVSEEVRSIIKSQIRRYGQEPSSSDKLETKKVVTTNYKTKNLVKEEMIKRLKKIIEELQDE